MMSVNETSASRSTYAVTSALWTSSTRPVHRWSPLIVRRGSAALRLGGGVYDVDATDRTTEEICTGEPFCTDFFVAPEDERGGNVYAYGTLAVSRSMTVEAGLAYETVNLLERRETALAILYAAGTVVGGALACALGMLVERVLR